MLILNGKCFVRILILNFPFKRADSNFLNKEVLPLLTKYKMKYNVTHIQSSGLISKYEATTQPVSDTAPSSDAQVSDAQPPQQ